MLQASHVFSLLGIVGRRCSSSCTCCCLCIWPASFAYSTGACFHLAALMLIVMGHGSATVYCYKLEGNNIIVIVFRPAAAAAGGIVCGASAWAHFIMSSSIWYGVSGGLWPTWRGERAGCGDRMHFKIFGLVYHLPFTSARPRPAGYAIHMLRQHNIFSHGWCFGHGCYWELLGRACFLLWGCEAYHIYKLLHVLCGEV